MTIIHTKPQTLMANQKRDTSPSIHNHLAQTDKYKDVPKDLLEVAESMESQFTNHLLKEMRKSVGTENSQHQKIYESFLDSERSQLMAKTNSGVGVKDLVIEQYSPGFKTRITNPEQVKIYQKQVNSQQGESHE